MKSRKYLSLAILVVASFLGTRMAVADDAPERVLYDARIFTAEPDHPYNEAWWRTR